MTGCKGNGLSMANGIGNRDETKVFGERGRRHEWDRWQVLWDEHGQYQPTSKKHHLNDISLTSQ